MPLGALPPLPPIAWLPTKVLSMTVRVEAPSVCTAPPLASPIANELGARMPPSPPIAWLSRKVPRMTVTLGPSRLLKMAPPSANMPPLGRPSARLSVKVQSVTVREPL